MIAVVGFLLSACDPATNANSGEINETTLPIKNTAPVEPTNTETVPAKPEKSVVRINSTLQRWNTWQPWEKDAPSRRRALGAIVGENLVLTTAEMAADVIFLEFESIDGTQFLPAKTLAIDYEANLALLTSEDDEEAQKFFNEKLPLETAPPPNIGDEFEIVQVESNGSLLETIGKLQSVSLRTPMVPSGGFLTYMVKASMQDASSSYSLPVLREGKLAGILFSYDSKDQICEVSSTEIVNRFLASANDGTWKGFPSLGVAITYTDDPSLRKWLKLDEDQGGIYLSSVRKGSAADQASLEKGDVILSVDGKEIDRRGYCQHSVYGNVSWEHWIRGERSAGESVDLTIIRKGELIGKQARLLGSKELPRIVPAHQYDQAPNYLVKGGLIFQELSLPVLTRFGKDWRARAPLNLLEALENQEVHEGKMERVVFLSGVIPTPATIGYENLRHLIISEVNGQTIGDLADVITAFDENEKSLHSIQFASQPLTIHLDEILATQIDSQLMQRGLRALSRVSSPTEPLDE